MTIRRESLLLLLVAGLCQAREYTRTVSYEDEMVARCTGVRRERFQELLELDGLDVWSISPDGAADIRMKKDLYSELKVAYPECSILHSSVEEIVREAERQMRPKNLTAEWFEEYHPYEEIIEWYKKLADDYTIVEFVESIGKSYEGRDQPAVHITANTDPDNKVYYFFQCQIHAREWISGATCMYMANQLAEGYGKDEGITELLEKAEFIFIPFMNPDGYVYSWTNDRLWRKNLRPGNSTSCPGVDLNRNYPIQWGGEGSSGNECSEIYRGSSAASEPEVQNSINYFKSHSPIYGSIDWHSYSQLIMRPYGWTTADSPDEVEMKAIGDEMSNVIREVHGKGYTSQKKYQLYGTSGTTSDWFYSDDANSANGGFRSAGIAIELRDTGQYGFLLPPDQIIPTGEEVMPAMLYFAEKLYANPFKY